MIETHECKWVPTRDKNYSFTSLILLQYRWDSSDVPRIAHIQIYPGTYYKMKQN